MDLVISYTILGLFDNKKLYIGAMLLINIKPISENIVLLTLHAIRLIQKKFVRSP